jgi:acetyltransferase-like isoleucine patch superfamily enzyme
MKKQIVLLAINNFVFLLVVRVCIYAAACLPFVYLLTQSLDGNAHWGNWVLLAFAAAAIPFLIVLEVGMVCYIMPKPSIGKHPFFSKGYYRMLRLQEVHEIVLNTPLLNNLVNRIELVRFVFHFLTRTRTQGFSIFAPDVMLLDPYAIKIGSGTFFGMNAILGPHIVRGNAMWLMPIEIGDNVLVGAYCRISCNTTIGDGCKLDFGVEISNDVTLGNHVTVLGKTMIDSHVRIGERTLVGKGCFIGKKARIGADVILGTGCIIPPDAMVPPGTRLPDFTTFQVADLAAQVVGR